MQIKSENDRRDWKLPEPAIIFGTVLTMIGIGLLTLQQSFVFHSGDLLCLCGAASYAAHILLTDSLTKKEDGLVCSIIFEKPALPSDTEEWIAVLSASVLSQKNPNKTADLII